MAGEAFDNWAVWAVIAIAGVGQRIERVAHFAHQGNLGVEMGDVFFGQLFDIGAGATAIFPQAQQVPDFTEGETQVAGTADEGEAMDVFVAIVAIIARAAGGGGDKADGFVMANHFGGDAGGAGCVADLHAENLRSEKQLDLTMMGRCTPYMHELGDCHERP